jgi:hypothetical protein
VAGRPVSVVAHGRDIRIAWGEAALPGSRDGWPDPGHSLAPICGGWAGAGRKPPVRVVALWPARLWRPAGTLEVSPSSLRVLADDPPVIWWGWSEPGREHDLVRWSGLRERIRDFLATLPPVPDPARSLPVSPIPDPGSRIQD